MKWYKVWTTDFSAPVMLVRAETLKEAIKICKQEHPNYSEGEEYKQANKCPHYRRQQIKERRETWTGRTYYVEVTIGVCYSVSNQSRRCWCNGDETRCDFFPEKRSG